MAKINTGDPKENMYGALPCPRCRSIYRVPYQNGFLECDKCGYIEKYDE